MNKVAVWLVGGLSLLGSVYLLVGWYEWGYEPTLPQADLASQAWVTASEERTVQQDRSVTGSSETAILTGTVMDPQARKGESLPTSQNEQAPIEGVTNLKAQKEDFEDQILNVDSSLTPDWSVEALIEQEFVGKGLELEAIEATNPVYTRYRISYLSNEMRVSGIMNIPQGEGPFPLVILNHGYIDPVVYTVGRGLKREQDYLARNGYAVLHTDYRNHGLSDRDPRLEENYIFRSYFYAIDAIGAVLAVEQRGDPRIDTESVGMLGHSMGGGVTMHAMIAQPELIDAAILYAPVHSNEYYNFHRWRGDDLSDEERQARSDQIGDLDQVATFAPYSAARQFARVQTPIQIYHGTQDESVPYRWSEDTLTTLQRNDKPVELITYTWGRHEFIAYWPAFMEGVVAFLDEELK